MSPRHPAVLDEETLALLARAREAITTHVRASHAEALIRAERDALIRQLIERGTSLGRIAAELELTKSLVAAVGRAAPQEVPDPSWPSWAPGGGSRRRGSAAR